LWFTAAGSLIVVGISFFLFRTFEQSQLREQQRTLAARMQDVVSTIDAAEDDESLIDEFANIRRSIEQQNALSPRGRLGITIREGDRVLLNAGIVEAHDGEQHVLAGHAQAERGGRRYAVNVLLDQTDSRDALDDFRQNTYIALVAGVALLALAGAFVARRAMRPLARITAATQTLDVGSLDHSLDAAAWPSELRALAAEFGQMQIRLRESFQRLTQFSDDLAHELRTPLNNLMSAAEVTLAQSRSTEEYRETLGSMLEETNRLRRMIDELLFLARAEQPERTLERTALDAREEASAVVEFFSALADENRVTVSVEGRGTLQANRDLLRRALSNLLGNALQYTPAGKSVRIVVSDSMIEVRDEGSGIDSSHLPHLFDRFYRVDQARSGYPEGTGLGLSIVKSIMTLHGGTVTVTSPPGQGSIFTLTFPRMTKL
jgi:two-component system heavy metal sensor histidine kinase CusS